MSNNEVKHGTRRVTADPVVEQKARLLEAKIEMSDESLAKYVAGDDDLGLYVDGEIALGYKKCGCCGHLKKFYLYNRNSGSAINCSGSCKACQNAKAKQSYKKTKKKRNYKRYYQENKEKKQEHARRYYAENKERLDAKHKEYIQSKKGKKVMQKAHAKRREALRNNAGIAYDRNDLITRDAVLLGLECPVCIFCGEPIKDPTSGKEAHIDHLIPVVQGGKDCLSNVHLIHARCNLVRKKDGNDVTSEMIETIADRTEKFLMFIEDEQEDK